MPYPFPYELGYASATQSVMANAIRMWDMLIVIYLSAVKIVLVDIMHYYSETSNKVTTTKTKT